MDGGIFVSRGPLTIAETRRVTRNTAVPGSADGGGNFCNASGDVTLLGANPFPIVVDNCRENCRPAVFVAKCAATPIFCPS
jgi:hypothetical protein